MKKVLNLGVLILLIFTALVFGSTKVYASIETIELIGSNLPIEIKAGDKLVVNVTNTVYSGGAYTEYLGVPKTVTAGVHKWGFGSSSVSQNIKYNGVVRTVFTYSTSALMENVTDTYIQWTKLSATTGEMIFLQDWPYPMTAIFNSSNTYNTLYYAWTTTTNFSTFGHIERESAVVNPTVTFDTAGGSSISPVVVTSGSILTLPDAPTKEGYTFDGWLLEGVAFDPGTLITADITLVASWIENPPEVFTVTFDSTGGSAVSDQSVTDGELATAPPDPSKTGYTFIHWYLDDPLVEFNFTTPITAAVTLHAAYQIIIYTVTYQDDLTILDTEDVTHGEFLIGFTPVKNNYTFDGWMLEGVLFDFETPITGSMTLDASWTENELITFTITFNSNGGSEVLAIEVLPDAYAIAPVAPTKESFTFTGWYSDPGLTQIFSFINTSISENITLYAKWTADDGGIIIPPEEENQSFLIEIISGISSIVIAGAAIITKKKGK